MPLPYNLQKLPPEALDVLRHMGNTPGSFSVYKLEQGTGLSNRLIGKAIRRLVNVDFIHMDNDGAYVLTTDGKIAVQQIADYDAEVASGGAQQTQAPSGTARHLTVVLPRQLAVGRPAQIFFGINAPDGSSSKLTGTVSVELKVSAVNGSLSAENVTLSIPPDKASSPAKLMLTPIHAGKMVRVRIDAFQSFEFDSMETLGGMFFDVTVVGSPPQDQATRAVGMDLTLKPPR